MKLNKKSIIDITIIILIAAVAIFFMRNVFKNSDDQIKTTKKSDKIFESKSQEEIQKEIKKTTGIDVRIKEGKVVDAEGKLIKNNINDGSSAAPQKSDAIKDIKQLSAEIIKLSITKNGFIPSSFEVKAGQAVKLAVSSNDEQLHVFKFKDLSLSGATIGVAGGTTRVLIFNAPEKIGEYHFFCEISGHKDKGEKGIMIVK